MKKSVVKALALGLCFALSVGACVGFAGCKEKIPEEEITVYMPDGAPALALAGLMHADKEDDGVTYRVVAAAQIASKVTNKDEAENADLCVMPVTAASKLLGSGERYTMLGGVTHGNLFLLKKAEEEPELSVTKENLSELVGKTVGVLQINEVPGLTFKAILNKHGVAWQELTNGGEAASDKVNLLAITGADAVGTVAADYFMIAEPAASAQAKKGYYLVGDLQNLYGGENGYPQAVLVAKNELVAEYGDWLAGFVEDVREGAAWLERASGEEIVATVSAHLEDQGATTSLKAPLLKNEVLARCAVRFTYAAEMRGRVDTFLEELLAVNDKAAAMPNAAFYWEYQK